MRELNLSISRERGPVYLRIAEALRQAIQSGRLKSGEPLPSSRRLGEMLGVHRHTVTAAADELVAEGWLEGGARRAYRVCRVLPPEFFNSKAGQRSVPASKLKWRLVREPPRFRSPPVHDGRYRYSFPAGVPELRLFPYDEFRACMSQTLRSSPMLRSGYGEPDGYPPFIERLSLYLRRVRALTGRRIIVTHGSQEALFLIAQLLLGPRDAVAVEELGYPPAWGAFRTAGARLVPIRLDEKGIVPEELEAAIGRHRVRLIYLTPHHQYPTTVTLTAARRVRLYELASRYRIPIVEEDCDHEFHYRCQPIAPLASSDPGELVIYCSTLSKIVFPSMRLGFIAVPEALYEPLVNMRVITTMQSNVFLQDAVTRWMDNGGFERHLTRMRRLYQQRRDALTDALNAGRNEDLPLRWNVPEGGMAVWLDCGVDSDLVAREAAERRVFVPSESIYRVAGPRPGTHLRLGYASQPVEAIQRGTALVLQAIASAVASSRGARPRKRPH
jgi:GntR family transcriptional regulator/MocR family aminotransferase